MTQLILNIPDDKVPFFKQLADELKIDVVVKEKKAKKLSPKQKKWVDDFNKALEEVDLHSRGKIKLKTAQQLIDEL